MKSNTRLALFILSASVVGASPHGSNFLIGRADPDNTVLVRSKTEYCLIVPKDAHTNVGDSEHPGGMTSYCSPSAHYSDSQGTFSPDFFISSEYKAGTGINGAPFVQLTGCINPNSVDRLDSGDAGGQYDSSGGTGGNGNPVGSACVGYNHYIEILEPAGPRACIKCCNDPADCPTNQDTQGCISVIPSDTGYTNCP